VLRTLLILLALPVFAQDIVIDGATIIDGNGGAPIKDGIVVISGKAIKSVGPRSAVSIPAGAKVIPAVGRYLIPGLIDTNVHLSLYGGARDRYETLAKYFTREDEIVLEAAQIDLRYGITTVRDSYGMLEPLARVRDAVARGQVTGARILAAGNIVGWGGPYSITFSLTPQAALTRFQEQMNDAIAQGAGETLPDLSSDELKTAINKYFDKGPDFLKYGATSHFSEPSFIGFSPAAQRVMVEEAHKRGLSAEVHSTTIEGLRLSLEAGIDLIQHPELMTPRELPDALVRTISERKVICSMLAGTITGEAWALHLKAKDTAQKKLDEDDKKTPGHPRTLAEDRRRATALGTDLETRRRNAQKLIQAGCVTTVGTDSYWGSAPEFAIDTKPDNQSHGIGTIMAIEGLVELGMTPGQALVSGTKNGAIASHRLKDLGTVESGKLADLVLLDADPLADIHNIRKVNLVFKEGAQIPISRFPERRILSVAADAPELSRVRLDTTAGSIVIELHRAWSPHGVDRFIDLVRTGYFDNSAFFRVIKDRWAQFGISADPAIANAWRAQTIVDDPRVESNTRGTVAFAFAVPNGRTTQVFINTRDNSPTHDKEPFVPIGKVVEGMDVADKLYSGYGETSGGGIRASKQEALFLQGNDYLERTFPKLDRIRRATVLEP
jgi:imidazolonepropionase-like amidohydrolase/cyclophilin family peptidyl-prolyl cis-trans isomerase